MRVLVGVVGGLLVALMLIEIFLTYLLPRRVKRDPRIVRSVSTFAWRPWRALARGLPPRAADTMLGAYGPLLLIINLMLWVGAMMLGYACLQWAGGSHLAPLSGHAAVSFGDDIFFSAATMASSGTAGLASHTAFERVVQVVDAASGLAVLTVVIAYLPTLYQAFSRREATVSQMDARAGSPPTAGRLVVRSTQHGGWPLLNAYLAGWEAWMADLMESHLAYPVLAYFRSQHVNQSWLASLCTVLDACALTIASAPAGTVAEARFTYAIARHAVADLSYSLHAQPTPPRVDRLGVRDFDELLRELADVGVQPDADRQTVLERLQGLREMYEPYVNALALRLELPLPQWLAPEEPTSNWRTTAWH